MDHTERSPEDRRVDRMNVIRVKTTDILASAISSIAEAYRERSRGLGLAKRRDRRTKTRTDALWLALEYTKAQPNSYPTVETVQAYATRFADWIEQQEDEGDR